MYIGPNEASATRRTSVMPHCDTQISVLHKHTLDGWRFCSRIIGQHLSDALRDLTTLIFDLEGHGTCRCRWCRSSCSAPYVPAFKFVGLPVWKILCIYCVSINRPGDLDLWPCDFATGARCCPWGGQPAYPFWCFYDVSFSTYQPTPDRRITFRPWPLTLVTALVGDTGLRAPSLSS